MREVGFDIGLRFARDQPATAVLCRTLASARQSARGLGYVNDYAVPPSAKRKLHPVTRKRRVTTLREGPQRA
jgi:hypothetical protein